LSYFLFLFIKTTNHGGIIACRKCYVNIFVNLFLTKNKIKRKGKKQGKSSNCLLFAAKVIKRNPDYALKRIKDFAE